MAAVSFASATALTAGGCAYETYDVRSGVAYAALTELRTRGEADVRALDGERHTITLQDKVEVRVPSFGENEVLPLGLLGDHCAGPRAGVDRAHWRPEEDPRCALREEYLLTLTRAAPLRTAATWAGIALGTGTVGGLTYCAAECGRPGERIASGVALGAFVLGALIGGLIASGPAMAATH